MTTTNDNCQRICVKVDSLRRNGYSSFDKWLADPDCIYIGRRGRIFIHSIENGEKHKRIFHYQESEWANQYTVKEYGLELFRTSLLNDVRLMKKLKELKGKKLGCWCNENEACHGDILMELLELIN